MPLPLKQRKVGSIEYIIKKLKGSDSYDNMKEHNEAGPEIMMKREDTENDYSIGMKQAVEEMMTSLESKDKQSFENGLRSYISMLLDAREDEEKLMNKE